jgi:solute carrier family 35, member F1/2
MGEALTGSSFLLSFTMSSNDGTQSPKKSLSDHGSIPGADLEIVEIQTPARPPVVYSSPKAFVRSFAARWKSIWTRRFILSLLAGQVASLCITCTNVTTTELVNRGWTLSTTQGFFLYVIHRQVKS